MRPTSDGCGCFPTGRHYPGIAHLLKVTIRGVLESFSPDQPWDELPIALLDVETTGRDSSVDRVVELGIVIGKGGEVIARHNWLINPGIPIPEEVRAIHGISDDDVKDSPRFAQIAQEVVAALRGAVPAAYNAAFDKAFVLTELGRAGVDTEKEESLRRNVEWVDPLVWAREIHAEEKSRALKDVAARLGITLENAHRASDDAEAALNVLYRLGKDPRVPRAYGAFVQEQRRISYLQADERRMWRN
ncbi:MAG: 3'-5' exonuclease [Polyangiaceae bacterium]|nr:3'-5' exonuclease [Polyangiaceae bacterium]